MLEKLELMLIVCAKYVTLNFHTNLIKFLFFIFVDNASPQ